MARPPAARMMRIHDALAGGGFPNCRGLAEKFEVSAKTVQRDIDFMRDQLLLPIEYDAPRHGFYYTKPVDRFPLISVSQGELVALLVAQKAVENYRGTAFEAPLRSAFDKLASSLDAGASVSLHELSGAVSFRPVGVAEADLRVYQSVAEAVVSSRVLEFDYRGLADKGTGKRKVGPLHLACIDGQWYLIGKDLEKNARRTFALSRMRRVRQLKASLAKAPGANVPDFLADSFSVFEAKERELVRIAFDAFASRLVSERKWHKSQKLLPASGGGCVLEMRVGVAPDLEKWILGWGAHAEVLAPESLRSSVAASARALVRLYLAG